MTAVERSIGLIPLLIVVVAVSLLWISRGHIMTGAMRIQEWWYGQHGHRAIQQAKDRHPSSPNNVYILPRRESQLYDQDQDAS